MEEPKKVRISVLTHIFSDTDAMYKSYMPFLNNGGVFLSVSKKKFYSLGEKVRLVMNFNIDGEVDVVKVFGCVAWITPNNAEGYRSEGIGFQFDKEDGGQTRNKFEDYLAGRLNSENPTHTL